MGNINCVAEPLQSKDVVPKERQLNAAAVLVFSAADGRLREFKHHPVKAGNVTTSRKSLLNKTFLANSEFLEVGYHVPHVPDEEVLQPGQLYFLLPISFSLRPLSLHDLCDLAVKAGAALSAKQGSFGGRKGGNPTGETKAGCVQILEGNNLLNRVEERLKLRQGSSFRR